jgi:hypothetical protein
MWKTLLSITNLLRQGTARAANFLRINQKHNTELCILSARSGAEPQWAFQNHFFRWKYQERSKLPIREITRMA